MPDETIGVTPAESEQEARTPMTPSPDANGVSNPSVGADEEGAESSPPSPAADLQAALAGRRTAIKPALLDQRVVAGVGNIYADESLFRAGIRPERSAGSLTRSEVERLAEALRAVLHEAVEGGGTTSDEYVDVHGLAGRYTPRVYDRGGAPCLDCGTTLTRCRLGGRGTVYCPQCQS